VPVWPRCSSLPFQKPGPPATTRASSPSRRIPKAQGTSPSSPPECTIHRRIHQRQHRVCGPTDQDSPRSSPKLRGGSPGLVSPTRGSFRPPGAGPRKPRDGCAPSAAPRAALGFGSRLHTSAHHPAPRTLHHAHRNLPNPLFPFTIFHSPFPPRPHITWSPRTRDSSPSLENRKPPHPCIARFPTPNAASFTASGSVGCA
jgi:hypothetical protein